jgi:hypothetical protein
MSTESTSTCGGGGDVVVFVVGGIVMPDEPVVGVGVPVSSPRPPKFRP